MLAGYLSIFWAMQISANVAFKYGSHTAAGRSRRWLAGFVGGNIVGASSIYFLMRIYEQMPENCNLAAVLAGSGGFIGSQILLAWMWRSRLSLGQWIGIALVAIGTVIATLGQPGGQENRGAGAPVRAAAALYKGPRFPLPGKDGPPCGTGRSIHTGSLDPCRQLSRPGKPGKTGENCGKPGRV